ncbi:hypothetical protein KAR91_46530 [Candidatus Pacearchaeota archaeon]|nr:hypothetical protein [Candidatus Pacearchaeota archaeon]
MKKGLISAIALAKTGSLYAPPSFKTTPVEELAKVCNGCGSASAKIDFVPDKIWGTYIGEACQIHDWMYHIGRSHEDKAEADRSFLYNIYRLLKKRRKKYKPMFLMRIRAKNYYNAVKYFGGDAFWNGKPGN